MSGQMPVAVVRQIFFTVANVAINAVYMKNMLFTRRIFQTLVFPQYFGCMIGSEFPQNHKIIEDR